MHNPVYRLILSNLEPFKKNFSILIKTAKENGKDYFLISSKSDIKPLTLPMQNKEYILKDWHISVYEDLRDDQGNGNASYHVTMNFHHEDSKLTARLYFDNFNNLLFITYKDQNNNPISKDSISDQKEVKNVILQFTKNYTESFSEKLWDAYSEKLENFIKKYEALLAKLNDKSDYNSTLDEILKTVAEWSLYELRPDSAIMNLFKQLEALAADKIQGTNNNNTSEVFSENKLKNTITGEDKTPPIKIPSRNELAALQLKSINDGLKQIKENLEMAPWNKITQEYNLLTAKFKLINNDDEVLECLLRIRALEKSALDQFNNLLIVESTYKKVSYIDLEALLKVIPFIKQSHYYLAVHSNRMEALKALLQTHKYINLDIPVKPGLTLLQHAYNKKYSEIFNLLLQSGVSCDAPDNLGNTLLMQACMQERKDEMVVLLKAGASNYIQNSSGFTAFGILTMQSKKIPNQNLIKQFIKWCQLFQIDFMQGQYRMRGTPLVFACQQGWNDVVMLYLQENADPNISRETDLLTAFGVCVAKNNVKLCAVLLENSKYPLNQYLLASLKLANSLKNDLVANFLTKYINEHKISHEENSYKFGPGTSISVLDDLRSGFFNKKQKAYTDFWKDLNMKGDAPPPEKSSDKQESDVKSDMSGPS